MSDQPRNYCQGFCRSCGTACEDYTREVLRLRAEAEHLRAALAAIAAKGEASPGDKKAKMARDALAGVDK